MIVLEIGILLNLAAERLCLEKLKVCIQMEYMFSDSLFSILHAPLVIAPIYYRYESVLAKRISQLISLCTVGNYFATLFVQFCHIEKHVELPRVYRSDACVARFVLRFGFRQDGTK